MRATLALLEVTGLAPRLWSATVTAAIKLFERLDLLAARAAEPARRVVRRRRLLKLAGVMPAPRRAIEAVLPMTQTAPLAVHHGPIRKSRLAQPAHWHTPV